MVNLKELIKKFHLDKKPILSKKYQQTTKAQNSVNNAIRAGKIKRPNICHSCLIKCKPDAHHPNYDKPYLIWWLCRSCHIDLSLYESHKNF